MLFGPGKARHYDYNLSIYEAAGFRGEQADRAQASVFTFVLGNALGPVAAASLTKKLSRQGHAEELMRGAMEEARGTTAHYPRLRDRLGTEAAEYGMAPHETFEFGLQTLLDGLPAQVGRAPDGSGSRVIRRSKT
ncbi:MAG TPA: TetR/AcrR family transcriptional regulator C-terminal domain-containing protein [Acidimicrobiales bacterium]|nr:TetR/AcrR family transcriptional regulator C-terminal domain-containing protein [Acidimicrobiales bacterium]